MSLGDGKTQVVDESIMGQISRLAQKIDAEADARRKMEVSFKEERRLMALERQQAKEEIDRLVTKLSKAHEENRILKDRIDREKAAHDMERHLYQFNLNWSDDVSIFFDPFGNPVFSNLAARKNGFVTDQPITEFKDWFRHVGPFLDTHGVRISFEDFCVTRAFHGVPIDSQKIIFSGNLWRLHVSSQDLNGHTYVFVKGVRAERS